MKKLPFDISRCLGSYEGINGEFGRMLDSQCVDCARRLQTEHHQFRQPWMTVEVMQGQCKFKIENDK